MDLDRLIDERVGRERYEEACRWAWRTAAGTGAMDRRDAWPDDLEAVPHDVGDLIWESDGPARAERIALTFAAYRAMPCYALVAVLNWEAWADDAVLAEFRTLLESERDELADPVAYNLWVDLFEAGELKAWDAVSTLEGDYERRLQRVLVASGPVAFAAKARLYERLVGDPRWHPWIFKSLLHSAYDVCGDFDPPAARVWLDRLDLPGDTPHLAELQAKL